MSLSMTKEPSAEVSLKVFQLGVSFVFGSHKTNIGKISITTRVNVLNRNDSPRFIFCKHDLLLLSNFTEGAWLRRQVHIWTVDVVLLKYVIMRQVGHQCDLDEAGEGILEQQIKEDAYNHHTDDVA